MTCQRCNEPVAFWAYASYNADNGENAHALHARYPMPMIRACPQHLAELMFEDTAHAASTRQWLVVLPLSPSAVPHSPE